MTSDFAGFHYTFDRIYKMYFHLIKLDGIREASGLNKNNCRLHPFSRLLDNGKNSKYRVLR